MQMEMIKIILSYHAMTDMAMDTCLLEVISNNSNFNCMLMFSFAPFSFAINIFFSTKF